MTLLVRNTMAVVDEMTLKLEIREEAERYLRDHVPLMEAVAKRYETHWRKTHMRATATVVPASHAPVRLGCSCHEHAMIPTCGRQD